MNIFEEDLNFYFIFLEKRKQAVIERAGNIVRYESWFSFLVPETATSKVFVVCVCVCVWEICSTCVANQT